jgi:hypothetical protein
MQKKDLKVKINFAKPKHKIGRNEKKCISAMHWK